jgi:immunoglobulin-binding protein 1
VPLPPSDTSPTDFDLIAALLPHSTPDGRDEEELDDSEEEQRTATLLLLRLAYTQAHAQLASIAEEFELLRTAPPPPPPSQPGTSGYAPSSPEAESTLWTLDAPRGGPLLDSTGKVRDPSLIHTASRLGE